MHHCEMNLGSSATDRNDTETAVNFYGKAPVVIYSISIFVSFLSATILLIICCKRILRLDTLSTLLLGALTVSNLVLLVFFIISYVRRMIVGINEFNCKFSHFCVATGFVWMLTDLWTLFWTLIIGTCCSVELIGSFKYPSLNKKMIGFLFVISLGAPVLILTVALSYGALGWTDTPMNHGWCWITTCNQTLTATEQWVWMLVTSKLWEMLCAIFVVNIIFMGYCFRLRKMSMSRAFPWASVKRTEKNKLKATLTFVGNAQENENMLENPASTEEKKETFETIKSSGLFLWIPIILIVTRIGGIVRFYMDTYAMFRPDEDCRYLMTANRVFELYEAVGKVSQPTFNLALVLIVRYEARNGFQRGWVHLFNLLRGRTPSIQAPPVSINISD